ncbi:GNAT family N-acetyltransferase [Roseibium sp.]|uniref:GNAT family N-acetyltransferase n=1 Tax=Roseibium sp. TaxID=1936156 RepID=UPI003A97F39D
MQEPDRTGVEARLETQRLILRPPQETDYAEFLAYSTSDRTRYVGGPKTEDLCREKFDDLSDQWRQRGFGRFIIVRKDTGQPLGHVGPLQDKSGGPVEMTWTLWRAEHEGQGFALEAAQAALKWAFEAVDQPYLDAMIHPENKSSIALALRLDGRHQGDEPHEHMGRCSVFRLVDT